MLVGTDDTTIDEVDRPIDSALGIGLLLQTLEKLLP
jgi:hypothetical protein